MANLKIRIYKEEKERPKTTITVPLGILKLASKLIPKKIASGLSDKGMDITEIIKFAAEENVRGVLAEIEEHYKDEKIVISVE